MVDLRRFAKDQPCTLRLEGVCANDPAQTVLCHLGGAGMAIKRDDYDGLHACAPCHAVMDMRMKLKDTSIDLRRRVFRARYDTQTRLVEAGHL